MMLLLLSVSERGGRRLQQDNNILFALKQETAIRYFTHNYLCQSVWKTYWIFWEADLALTTSRHWTKAITRFLWVFFRVFMGKNAFGFCLQTEILSFWYFVNFLMRRQKSPVQKGVIQPSFCTPGKIFAWSSSFDLSSTWPCVFYRVEISSFAEHSGTNFLLR